MTSLSLSHGLVIPLNKRCYKKMPNGKLKLAPADFAADRVDTWNFDKLIFGVRESVSSVDGRYSE
jgi:hypothetical protein